MMKKSVLVFLCIFLLGPIGSVMAFDAGPQPELVGWWPFDEGEGTVAYDASGNGNDGVFNGDPQWVPGMIGGALEFNGDDYVNCGNGDSLQIQDEITIAFWFQVEAFQTTWEAFLSKGDNSYRASRGGGNGNATHMGVSGTSCGGGNGWFNGTVTVTGGDWHHFCATYDGASGKIYIDGVLDVESAGTGQINISTYDFWIGSNSQNTGRLLNGIMDDVRLYNRALTEGEVSIVMAGYAGNMATNPSPEDGAVDIPRDVVLEWEPMETATMRDVYFGTVFDDVNEATRTDPRDVLVSQGQSETTYDPEGLLDFGQTYYWRIDEVNAAPDNTIFKGDVWSFTAEPFAYAVDNVVATSNTVYAPDQGPENVVNGSGLDENDQHATDTKTMWAGSPPTDGSTPYIAFEFDRVYKVHELLVWNYNMAFEAFLGLGIKETTIEYSEDGTTWTTLGDFELNQAPGTTTYTYSTVVPFEGVPAKAVRLNVNSSWSPAAQLHGLSEVRFTYIPVQAREPEPADGATDVAIESTLGWRSGREAVSHEIYLGTDPNALSLDGTTTTNSYDPGILDLDTTTYWQVVEVNEAEAVPAWASDVWSFSTQEYLVVDDFDSYIDDPDAGDVIWEIWIDGLVEFGGDPDNGGGVVGHAMSPFAEQTIVRGGQSMPFYFDNPTASAISEADRTLSPAQNWNQGAIKSLSLWFYGQLDNTGQLYVAINGTKVVYDGEPADIARAQWQPWNIDLSTVGANLNSVSELSIGVQGAGSGVVYIDDIRLYGKAPEFVVPTAPDAANLAGLWSFEGNPNDSSGNGRNGTLNGNPTYVSGVEGQAINFNGSTDYVVVGSVGISGTAPRTISGWAKPDTLTIPDWCNIFGFTASTGAANLSFDMNKRGGQNQYCIHVYGWERNIMEIDLEWHHLAATYDGTTIAWYGDGRFVGSEDREIDTEDIVQMGKRAHSEVMWPGSVDEVAIYSTALSPEEIAGLAGRTSPVHVPF